MLGSARYRGKSYIYRKPEGWSGQDDNSDQLGGCISGFRVAGLAC
jgi:hypothetical protein